MRFAEVAESHRRPRITRAPPSAPSVEGLTLQRTSYASSDSKFHMWFAEEDMNVSAPNHLRRPEQTRCGATADPRREGAPANRRHALRPGMGAPAPEGARDPGDRLPFNYNHRPLERPAGQIVSRERHPR